MSSFFDDGRTLVLASLAGLVVLSRSPQVGKGSSAVVSGSTTRRREKQEILELSRKLLEERFQKLGCPTSVTGTCLWNAAAVIAAAKKRGVRLVLQAGSAFWPRVTSAQDDGVSSTHFGYQWEPHSPVTQKILAQMRKGDASILPEMHVWAADPKTHEIVDPTSGQFPAQAMRLQQLDWKAPSPPDAFWGGKEEMDRLGAAYDVDRDATMLAFSLMTDLLEEEI